jgi:uncharacterized protein YaeQ
MAQPSILYRFHFDLSDIDNGVYKTFDLRTAMHPSESPAYLITRLIAFVLNDMEFLEFSPGGLSDPEEPALKAATPHGDILLWVEIGNPSARKLHKAAKAARQVKVYTYKDPDILLKEIRDNKVHKAEEIKIFSLSPKTLEALGKTLERTNKWAIMLHEGVLNITVGDRTESTELAKHQA